MFIVNVEGAIFQDGKWLLIRRGKNEEHAAEMLSLVGGKCEKEGNSSNLLERSLVREIYEEVGIEVEVLNYVNSSSFVSDTGDHVVDIVFLCKILTGEAYPKSVEEVDEVVWMTTAEIINDVEIPDYLKSNIKQASELVIKAQ